MATIAHNGCRKTLQHLEPKMRKSNKSAKENFESFKQGCEGIRAFDGAGVISRDKLLENFEKISDGQEAMGQLWLLVSNPPKSVHKQLQMFRKYTRAAIEYQFYYQEMIDLLSDEFERLLNGVQDRSGKRWSDVEDEVLVDLASRDNVNMTMIAMQLGRTPSAIQTRLSYLVGIKRVSTKVAGKFIGWFNGEQVDGDIDGVVTTA